MSIFEDPTKCEERKDLVVSAAVVPPDMAKQVRQSKIDPFAPSNSVQHPERPRYGHDY